MGNTRSNIKKLAEDLGLIYSGEIIHVGKNKIAKYVVISQEGYKALTTANSLKIGTIPKFFYIRNPYTIENIQKYLIYDKRDIKLLSTEYKGSNFYMKWKCEVCDYEWEDSLDHVKGSEHRGCGNCIKNSKYSHEIFLYKCRLVNPDIDIIGGTYNINTDYLRCKCRICGYEWNGMARQLLEGHNGCEECYNVKRINNKKLSKYEIIARVYKLHSDRIKVIDSFLKKGVQGWWVTYRCNNCGEIYTKSYRTIESCKSDSICTVCGVANAYYSTRSARENQEEWLKVNAVVYVIKCWNEKEMFYKIGLTKRTIEKRFNSKGVMPYNYEIIHKINTNLYDAVFKEFNLHKENREYRYNPKIKFPGSTECFYKFKTNGLLKEFLSNKQEVIEQ